MGIITEVGPDVKKFKVGERVVASAVIACGQCLYASPSASHLQQTQIDPTSMLTRTHTSYCQNGWFSCCDRTNPSDDMIKLYGHKLGGIFGYTHLTGGFDGGQAEYARSTSPPLPQTLTHNTEYPSATS